MRLRVYKIRAMSDIFAVNVNVSRSVRGMTSLAVQETRLKSWREVPGPSSLPFIGPIHNFFPGGKLAGLRGVNLSERLYKLYGPIAKLDGIFGGYDTVFLFDPEAVEYVLRSEDPMPIRPSLETLEYYRKRHNKTYDPKRITGLNDHGENWREFRTKVNPIMMHPKTIKLYTNVLEEVSNDMVTRLRSIRDEDNNITTRLNVEMNLWALESIGVVALGTRLNCFDPNLPADSPAKKLIQNVHEIFNMADKLDFTPSLWRLYSTPNFKKNMKIYEEHERLTKYFIDQAMKNLEESKKKAELSNSEKPVLEKLLEIDVETARVMASDMLLAGIDTELLEQAPHKMGSRYTAFGDREMSFCWIVPYTPSKDLRRGGSLIFDGGVKPSSVFASNTVLATLYLLATNPAKQKKLREELLNKPNKKPYLGACIKESRRALPVVLGNVRLLSKDYNLLGYKIPKNVLVLFAHQYMSKMEEHYPRPDEFIPERWLTDKNDPLYHGNTHPFVTATFGFGVRMCMGRRIAQLEMETIISKIIENFEIDWTSSEPLHIAPTSLNYITEPFHFAFKDL